MNDYMAMRQIIAIKGSPRLLIRASGEISDIGNARKLIDGQLREIALKCGFQTIRISQFNEAKAKRTKRDKFLGKNVSAAYRGAGIRDNYDFVIDVEVSGAYNGTSKTLRHNDANAFRLERTSAQLIPAAMLLPR